MRKVILIFRQRKLRKWHQCKANVLKLKSLRRTHYEAINEITTCCQNWVKWRWKSKFCQIERPALNSMVFWKLSLPFRRMNKLSYIFIFYKTTLRWLVSSLFVGLEPWRVSCRSLFASCFMTTPYCETASSVKHFLQWPKFSRINLFKKLKPQLSNFWQLSSAN